MSRTEEAIDAYLTKDFTGGARTEVLAQQPNIRQLAAEQAQARADFDRDRAQRAPTAKKPKKLTREQALEAYINAEGVAGPAQPGAPPSDIATPSRAQQIGRDILKPFSRAGEAGVREATEGLKGVNPFGRGTEGPVEAATRVGGGLLRLLNSPVAAAGAFASSPFVDMPGGQYRPPLPGGRSFPSAKDVVDILGQSAAGTAMSIPRQRPAPVPALPPDHLRGRPPVPQGQLALPGRPAPAALPPGPPSMPALERGPLPMGPTPPIPMGPVPPPVAGPSPVVVAGQRFPGSPPPPPKSLMDQVRERYRRSDTRPSRGSEAPLEVKPGQQPLVGDLLDAQGRPIPMDESPKPSMTERERLRRLHKGRLDDPPREAPPPAEEAPPVATEERTASGRRKVTDPSVFGIDFEEGSGLAGATAPPRGVTRGLTQDVITDTPKPEIPKKPIKAKGPQGDIKDTPLYGQERDAVARTQQDIPTSGTLAEPAGTPPPSHTPTRKAFTSKREFEHGQPNLSDPDDVYDIVTGAGRLKIVEDFRGELKDIPHFFKSKKGTSLDDLANSLADEYPGLGDSQAIKEKLSETLSRYQLLKDAKKKGTGQARPPLEEEFGPVKKTEINTETPPQDIPVDVAEWKAMGEVQRKGLLEFFRDAMNDESGRIDLAQMAKAWKRFRQRFPMEEAVRTARPNSPVISEVERFNVGLADWISAVTNAGWRKAMKGVNPEVLKDAEEAAVQEWIANGRTPAAARAARHHFPQSVQDAMAHRDARLPGEQQAKRYFGINEIPENEGPYIPRHVDADSRHAVTLGSGKLGQGRGVQSGVGGHSQQRSFETFRAGEATGLEYGDPRNSILLREWEGLKMRATERLFRRLEGNTLFRDKQAAQAASPTGQPWVVENAPGGTWWATTEAEAKFLKQNLSNGPGGPTGSLVHYANAAFRNPNLVNPAPHFVKNMAMKALLARGPVAPYTLARDAVEYFRNANPGLLREFKEAMPFSDTAKTAEQILTRDLQKGTFGEGVKRVHDALGMLNRPSQKVIFEWADPAMRYSLYKHYRGQGMGVYEAGNHAWVDLIRYGTRSQVTDMWKMAPLNFFVPWRYGTFVSLLKQAQNHPVRTALLLGAVDYLREVRYRQDGKWTHVPWDYVEAPIAQILGSRSGGEFTRNVGSQAALTALFGPGGAFGASQMDKMLQMALLKGDKGEYEQLLNMFWGLSQLYNLPQEFKKGDYSGMVGTALLGEHNAYNYEPKRVIGKMLPDWLPGMTRSPAVELAERQQREKRARYEASQRRRSLHPSRSIEDKLRDAGLVR